MDARGWALLAVGGFAGACVVLVSGAVRDALVDLVDQVVGWWWDVVDALRLALLWACMLIVTALALWAVVALLLPRLAEK
ncbi:hypothetical protein AB0A95_33860 [Micromonospora sp. NPDC049230]|uniref:hypothetical protein n=1 Tax=Micromonospora sp. NPDC049230 TaxID=3155502 RepID=UPI0033D9D66E